MSHEGDSCTNGLTPDELEKMEKFGISRFAVYYYQSGQYRYANLRDAIAQAEREDSRTVPRT